MMVKRLALLTSFLIERSMKSQKCLLYGIQSYLIYVVRYTGFFESVLFISAKELVWSFEKLWMELSIRFKTGRTEVKCLISFPLSLSPWITWPDTWSMDIFVFIFSFLLDLYIQIISAFTMSSYINFRLLLEFKDLRILSHFIPHTLKLTFSAPNTIQMVPLQNGCVRIILILSSLPS